jgi:hypothetical protein
MYNLTMTIQQLFVRSNEELKRVILQIKDDQWNINMPAGLTSKPATLKEAVNYHIYDDAWVPDVLTGRTIEEVGDTYKSLLTTQHTKDDYVKYNALASSAVASFQELERITHLSYGDYSAHDYLQHITIFRSLRSYDIAKLIGVSTAIAPDFLQGLWDEYSPLVEQYRQYGILPSAIPSNETDDLQTAFLALVGRQ